MGWRVGQVTGRSAQGPSCLYPVPAPNRSWKGSGVHGLPFPAQDQLLTPSWFSDNSDPFPWGPLPPPLGDRGEASLLSVLKLGFLVEASGR